jgi:hypothetical protein
MSAAPRIVSSTRPDATPETEAAALAVIYRLAIERYEKRAAGTGDGNDPQGPTVAADPDAEGVRRRLS